MKVQVDDDGERVFDEDDHELGEGLIKLSPTARANLTLVPGVSGI